MRPSPMPGLSGEMRDFARHFGGGTAAQALFGFDRRRAISIQSRDMSHRQ
jgi:hypothetical protein